MIIYRYLNREILYTTVAVSTTLLLIIMSGRFVKYLAEAAAGKMAVDVLLAIMAYRMPGFLELVVPLGFFIAILLAYGRLYMDSEMVVLSACGISQQQLLKITAVATIFMATLVGAMSLWISPWGALQTERLLAEQRSRSEFTMLRAGHFQRLSQGTQVMYIAELSDNRTRLNTLFFAELGSPNQAPAVTVAEYGVQDVHPDYQQRYLQFYNGVRYQGWPGSLDYQVTDFELFGQHLPEPDVSTGYEHEMDARSTADLWADKSTASQAVVQWRLSLPILVGVVALMAVPLSRTNPRQGRYIKMLPAILLYLFYLAGLSTLRSKIETGAFPLWPGLWLVHGIFLSIALGLIMGREGWQTMLRRWRNIYGSA